MMPLAKQCAFMEPSVETISGENVLTWPAVVRVLAELCILLCLTCIVCAYHSWNSAYRLVPVCAAILCIALHFKSAEFNFI